MSTQLRISELCQKGSVILLFLLLILLGCRKQGGISVQPGQVPAAGSAESSQPGILTGVYRGEAIPLPEEMYIYAQQMEPGGIRMDREEGEVTVWTMDAEGRGHIVTVSGEGVAQDDTVFEITEDRVLQCAAFGEHCFVWATAVYTDRRFIDEELNRFDLDTREVTTFPGVRDFFDTAERQEGEYGRFLITSAAVDADGDIWLATTREVVVLSPEFVFRTSFVSRDYSSSLSVSPDGSVWVSAENGFAVLDKKTGQDSLVRLRDHSSAAVFGDGYDFYYEAEQGVYGRNEDGSTLLMDYANSNILDGSAVFCGVLDPETFLFADEEGSILWYRSLGDIDLSTVPTIEIAFNVDGSNAGTYSRAIVEYNKSHPETRVIVTDYTKYNTFEDSNAGSQKLALDLITGTIRPDIVIAETRGFYFPDRGAEIDVMLEHKLYADLSGYLEADPELNPENLFGAVRRYFSAQDGGMWGISSGFQVNTLFGPTAFLEKWADGNGSSSGWTVTELLDYADSLPEGTYLVGGIGRENAALKLLGPDGYAAFIDWGNATCSFDSPEFLRWLKFLYALPKYEPAPEGSTPVRAGMRADTAEYYYTGRVMLDNQVLSGVGDAVENMEAWFGTKDWTIIGFPAEGHNGSYVECREAILMTSTCSQKDSAWDVIRSLALLGQKRGFPVFGIPIRKQVYEEKTENILETHRYLTIKFTIGTFRGTKSWSTARYSGEAVDGVFPTLADLGAAGWVSIPTAEDFARFEAFLDNDAGYPLTESLAPEITDIITEEISAYYAGVGSAEDCARKIQSRVSLWLAEHK